MRFVLVKAEGEQVSRAVSSVGGPFGLMVDSIRRWHASESSALHGSCMDQRRTCTSRWSSLCRDFGDVDHRAGTPGTEDRGRGRGCVVLGTRFAGRFDCHRIVWMELLFDHG